MKITDVLIKNFLTVGEDPIKINLDNKGMVLIMGDNRDDTSAISNGAGKSTIGDAICWCLFGETARGETGDAIVNNKIGKGCSVQATVDDEGVVYTIRRNRKHKEFKNSLQVFDVTAGTELTKGTDKLTQELVEKIVGCSLDVFRSAIYAAQDSIPNLPGMTDKNLKEIVEESAGVNRLAEAYQIARDDLKARESSLSSVAASLATARSNLISVRDDLEDLKAKKDSFAAETANKIASVAAEIGKLKTDQSGFSANPHLSIDEADTNKRLDELADELREFVGKKKMVDDELRVADKNLATVESVFKVAVDTAKHNLEKVKGITGRIGQPCGECGKPYCEEDLESAAEIAKKAFAKSKADAESEKQRVVDAKLAQKNAADAVLALGDMSAAIAKNKAAADDLRADLSRANDIRRKIAEIEKEIKVKEKQINDLKIAANPYEELFDKAQKKEADILASIVNHEAAEKAATEQRDLAASAVKVFSPAGVRAHVIDTVTPLLNDRTAHYLSVLSDGNIGATWNTLSKTKGGELREKFSIDVSNDKGSENFGGLSGGEKRKVRIATALALQDLVASRASKPINLFLADEIDDALDEAGLERLMMLLEEKAREKGTVLMISHNALGDWVREQAVVIKEGGFSRMEGALVI